MDKQTDRQMNRQTQTDRQTDRQASRQADSQRDRQTDRQADRQTDRQTDRPTDLVALHTLTCPMSPTMRSGEKACLGMRRTGPAASTSNLIRGLRSGPKYTL